MSNDLHLRVLTSTADTRYPTANNVDFWDVDSDTNLITGYSIGGTAVTAIPAGTKVAIGTITNGGGFNTFLSSE